MKAFRAFDRAMHGVRRNQPPSLSGTEVASPARDTKSLRRTVLGHLLLACALAIGVRAVAADEQPLVPRVAPQKPEQTIATPADRRDVIILKFKEGTGIHLQGQGFAAPNASSLPQLESALERFGVAPDTIKRLFPLPEQEVRQMREAAQARSGRELADLNLYYSIELPEGADIEAFADALNDLPYVELARPAPVPAPPPAMDLEPPTPSFVGGQGYLAAPPTGIGALDARVAATQGAGITIADIEYHWVWDHEDFDNIFAAETGPYITTNDPQGDHGTAVLGQLVGANNEYGVTGIVPAAAVIITPVQTEAYGYSPAAAINLAAAYLRPGDIMLIEQQICVCGVACPTDGSQLGLGPQEWEQPTFDAISIATGLGITVVEAAGNGRVDLDHPACQDRFNRNVRDSGAIIVGAGHPVYRWRLDFSSYGSRVDLQGWGEGVYTTGRGNLFDPGDPRQRYTHDFNGTSSASPMVAGAAAAIQSVLITSGYGPLSPGQVRELLVVTGTPQWAEHQSIIGPLPNLPAALDLLFGAVASASAPQPAAPPDWISDGIQPIEVALRAPSWRLRHADAPRAPAERE
jgi:serine protease